MDLEPAAPLKSSRPPSPAVGRAGARGKEQRGQGAKGQQEEEKEVTVVGEIINILDDDRKEKEDVIQVEDEEDDDVLIPSSQVRLQEGEEYNASQAERPCLCRRPRQRQARDETDLANDVD